MGRHGRKREDEGREGRRRVKVRKIPRKKKRKITTVQYIRDLLILIFCMYSTVL